MSEFKGTPGPWKAHGDSQAHSDTDFSIETASFEIVAYVVGEADANLIAVAPQLLLALQDAEEILRGALGAVPSVKARVNAYADLIAKALGK